MLLPKNVASPNADPVPPHGDALCDLVVGDGAEHDALKAEADTLPSVTLTRRQLCDLELLMNGGFSPLRGFMNRSAYESVLDDMRLPDGRLWPMPITLDVPAAVADKLEPGGKIGLRNAEGFVLATLAVDDVWRADKAREAERVYGTRSEHHPGVRYLHEQTHDRCVGGTVTGLQLPAHYEFEPLWPTPRELRRRFAALGWRRVVAFHTCRPMHRREREITIQAAKQLQAHVLLHPAVGATAPGDLQYFARVHCYQAITRYYPHNLVLLALLPLAMRLAGPREALWHALIRQNYGGTHFIVGPAHGAAAGHSEHQSRYAAQELIEAHQDELSIQMVPVRELSYVERLNQFLPVDEIERRGERRSDFTDEALRDRLARDEAVPEWYSYPEVLRELRKIWRPRSKQGFTLFFTGLSGAGKSTLANIIYAKLIEIGGRPVTLLDGDVVRQNLSSELGFSREHRDLNVRRIGFVAAEITKNYGVAICAPIAPYAATRRALRELIGHHGGFIEIHVATSLAVCEARDRKGMYAKARRGLIPNFTGISDPYEAPENPELRIDTAGLTPMEAAQEIFLYLLRENYLDTTDEYAGTPAP